MLEAVLPFMVGISALARLLRHVDALSHQEGKALN
jgi:hypothetical protein